MRNLLIALVLLAPSFAIADDKTAGKGVTIAPMPPRMNGQVLMGSKKTVCNDTSIVHKNLTEKLGEEPIFMGLVKNDRGNLSVVVNLYYNPQNTAFTIVDHFENGMSCVTTSGSDVRFKAIPQGS